MSIGFKTISVAHFTIYSLFVRPLRAASKGKVVEDLIQDPLYREIFWEEHQLLFPGTGTATSAAAAAAAGTLP
jgi:hypothetical protein